MDHPTIDLAHLMHFCDGDRTRMMVFIRTYLDTAPGTFAQLKEKLDAGDGPGLASVAHSLRPQVFYMGAQGLLDGLTLIEERARAEGTAACAPAIEEVMALSGRVSDELRQVLDAST